MDNRVICIVGPTAAGKIAVVIGLAVVVLIACANTFWKKED